MLNKKLCVAIIAFLFLHDTILAKKSRKTKRPKPEEEEENNPQPNVVSYSTFGFNDVGTYEGFVPSSPDYAKLLSGTNEETGSKVQSSAFPASQDSSTYGNNYDSQPYSGQSFSISTDEGTQPSLIQYPQTSLDVFNTQTFDANIDQNINIAGKEIYGRNTEQVNAPTYGTKINSRNKIRPANEYNNTDFTEPSNNANDDKYFNFHEAESSFNNKPLNSEITNHFHNGPAYQFTSGTDFSKPISSETYGSTKFQRVVDFTKLKQYYPTELDMSRLPQATPTPDIYETNESSGNFYKNTYSLNNSNGNKLLNNPSTTHRDSYDNKYNGETSENSVSKLNNVKKDSYNFGGYSSAKDNLIYLSPDSHSKKKIKSKPWAFGGHYFKKWKDPTPSEGYEYSTNYSSMRFKYDANDDIMTKPLGSSIDEVIPQSSNLDLPSYQIPETDFSAFKKMPEYKIHEDDDEYANYPSYKDNLKQNEVDYNHKYLFSTVPTTTSYWGNAYKSSAYASLKNHPVSKKHKYSYHINDEVVNIPRKPTKHSYEKPYEEKPNEFSHYNQIPYKSRPWKDWAEETTNTKFKSEEDLLGLRNQDTSHPSYLPSFQHDNFASEENDYKRLVDKWRQSYLKSKYKESLRDYEGYESETKPQHVPVPKPYPIEVPHPVIIPVPQPYPVRVPIAKPVAVPVLRELKIPIEKPMPYLVYKDVPFPVEKLVPVPVEKEVAVPVVKPYPVHIPYIRPVFHHTKSRDEYDSDLRDDDDYQPRPEGGKNFAKYKKKAPYRSRNRTRRPSRTVYQDRIRRRYPDRRRPSDINDDLPQIRPIELNYPSPFKRRDSVIEEKFSTYPRLHCKRTGEC